MDFDRSGNDAQHVVCTLSGSTSVVHVRRRPYHQTHIWGAEVTCSGILRKSPEVLGLGLGPVLLDQPSLDLELGIS